MSEQFSTPMWRLDSDAPCCALCHQAFVRVDNVEGIGDAPLRRHHCRWCGDVFCDAHSRTKARVRDGSLQKVCDLCAQDLPQENQLSLDPFLAVSLLGVGSSRRIFSQASVQTRQATSFVGGAEPLSRLVCSLSACFALARLWPVIALVVSPQYRPSDRPGSAG